MPVPINEEDGKELGMKILRIDTRYAKRVSLPSKYPKKRRDKLNLSGQEGLTFHTIKSVEQYVKCLNKLIS